MAFQLDRVQVDLKTDRVRVELSDNDSAAHVSIHVQIAPPGNQPAEQMEQIARAAAKQVVRKAMSVL
jgi:hypothetical protein